jgi:sphingomyelin phosphodiesterase acid-like 3
MRHALIRLATWHGCLAALFLLLAALPASAAEMLVLSDLHFDPTANKALVDRLAVAEPEQWLTILNGDDHRMSVYGEDANWKLLASALGVAGAQPKPGFVLITGDFLVHQFRSRFDSAATDHSDAAFRVFAAKTMRFLAAQLVQTFPGTPILPALGNNDDNCGDYELRPGGSFLTDTVATVGDLIGPEAGPAFRRSWQALGNYVVPNPAVKDHLVVALNTNFFSPHYKNACGTQADGNPARATLAWLRNVLHEAETSHQKVWLAYHIPPGIDAPATSRKTSCPITAAPMFAEAYAHEFHALMKRYRATVTASFAGHTHMDGFRLMGESGKDFGFVLMNPAISPLFGQNPGFRRVTVAEDGAIADQSVYYLANLPAAASGATPQWQLEMSFDAAWDLPRFDLKSVGELYHRISSVPAARDRWLDSYAVQGPGRRAVTAANEAIYRCTAGNDRTVDFQQCSCGGASP